MEISGKRRYNAPKIIVHGSIGQITKSRPSNKVKGGVADEFTAQDPGFGSVPLAGEG